MVIYNQDNIDNRVSSKETKNGENKPKMNKQEKIDFINEVFKKMVMNIAEAKNHDGGSDECRWWYPTPFTIAYDVKMRNFISIEELRKKMSDKQNKFYADDGLEQIIWDYMYRERDTFVEDIKKSFGISNVCITGRSGGWLEVRYQKNISPGKIILQLTSRLALFVSLLLTQ